MLAVLLVVVEVGSQSQLNKSRTGAGDGRRAQKVSIPQLTKVGRVSKLQEDGNRSTLRRASSMQWKLRRGGIEALKNGGEREKREREM